MYADVEKITFTAEEYVGGGIKTPYFYFVFNNDAIQWTYRIDATLGTVLEKSEVTLLISLQKAREIALNDAGITDENEATFTKEELNRSTDRPCWILEFYTEKYQYSYKIDAKTGEIVFNTRYISMAKAKTIALSDAEFSDSNKVVFTVEKLVDGGIKTPYYLFVFNNGFTQWTYRIDATDGSVMYRNKEVLMVSLDKAKEIALADAEIPKGVEVVFTKEILSRNSGRPCWILEFYTEKYQFSYKVDAKTGEVIFSRRYIYIERAREIALKDAEIEDVERVEFTVEELVDGGIKTPYYLFVFNNGFTQWTYRIDATDGSVMYRNKEVLMVSLDKAKEIALADAEIPKGVEVVFTKEILSRNSGRPCWILEFYTEKYQFSYKVDAKTGEVIFSRRYIYIERAREIALKDAEIEDVERVEFTVEELVDGGIKTPYYLFVFNNGRAQWTYRIDATDGGIQFTDKEELK